MNRPLTAKQKLFIEYYIQLLNATRAAEKAGYKGNSAVLAVVGHDNLRKQNIREAIQERFRETRVHSNEIVARLYAIATGEGEERKDTIRCLDILARHLLPTKVDVEADMRTEIIVNLTEVERDPHRPGQLRLVANTGGGGP